MKLKALILLATLLFVSSIFAKSMTITLYLTAQPKISIGTVLVKDTPYGLLITPTLHGLAPGLHGFHVHQFPSCANQGMAAGGHLDPKKTGLHLGPYNSKGHLGDLPSLYVSPQHTATRPILAPRLSVNDLIGHSLMIHLHGDNYSDTPKKLGGGGARFACGVIK